MLESEFYLDAAVEKDMRYISNRLREVREDYGESQLDFSGTLQVSRNTVYRQENTLNGLSVDYLLRLIRATDTPVESLFPPELRRQNDEIEKLYAQLNESNKQIVQSTIKALVGSLLSAQTGSANVSLQ